MSRTKRPGAALAGPLLAVALLGGCGSAPNGARMSAPDTGTPGATTGTEATGGAEQCLTAALRVEVGQGNHDMQGAHVPLRFTNTASQPCTLLGAPGVSYVTGEGGEQIGPPATRDTGGPVVTIEPGATASAPLFMSSAPLKTPDCRQVEVGGLRVYPPGNTEPVFVQQDATACESPLDEPLLEVGPVEPGADNTGL